MRQIAARRRLSRSDLLYQLYVLLVLAFIFAPIVVVVRYAFNARQYFTWPPAGFSLDWF